MSKKSNIFYQISSIFDAVRNEIGQFNPEVPQVAKDRLLQQLRTVNLPAAEECLKIASGYYHELSAMKSKRMLAKQPWSQDSQLPQEEFDKKFPDVPTEAIENACSRMLEKKQELENIKAQIHMFEQKDVSALITPPPPEPQSGLAMRVS